MAQTKPPLPTRMHEPFPRIAVNDAPDSPFNELLGLAIAAADRWMVGPDGPLLGPDPSPRDMVNSQLREALLHLLELGVIDIDEERMRAAPGWPMDRLSFRADPAGGGRG
ncbi:hypothetical protein [Streptosporangium longisporum]|uniref:Uncharacterized protein n=1 Tax=Streptosporangium longisporum TaxID=46187 RepID=A0ABP6KZ02_9ACTN